MTRGLGRLLVLRPDDRQGHLLGTDRARRPSPGWRRRSRGMVVEGIRTTIPFHLRVLGNAYFRRGEVDTHFLERRINLPSSG